MEKKGIKCSYAVLVCILFAALAFVVDYSIIERKTSKCPSNIIKQVGDSSGIVNNDSLESSKSGYVQKYLQYITYYNNGEDWRTWEIILNSDGTVNRNIVSTASDSSRLVGYYRFISNDKIVLALFDENYLTSYQCNNELSGSCQTALVLEYDSATSTYKANNITYTEVQKEDLKSLVD